MSIHNGAYAPFTPGMTAEQRCAGLTLSGGRVQAVVTDGRVSLYVGTEVVRTVGAERFATVGQVHAWAWETAMELDGTDAELFEQVIEAELTVKGDMASVVLCPTNLTPRLKESRKKTLKTSRARLRSLLDGMSIEQLRAYGEYRKAQLS